MFTYFIVCEFLHACMYVYGMYAWCHWRSEEVTGIPWYWSYE